MNLAFVDRPLVAASAIAIGCYFATPILINKMIKPEKLKDSQKADHRFFLVDMKDNLSLSVFIVALAALKTSEKTLKDPLFLTVAPLLLCRLFTRLREANSHLFSTFSHHLPKGKVTFICDQIAVLTKPSQL